MAIVGGLLYGFLCQRVTIRTATLVALANWVLVFVLALVPKERMTEFFGFFTLAGEAASVLGPFLWAATLALFPDKSAAGYRAGIAVLFVVLVFAIGAFVKVRFPVREAAAAGA